MDSPHDLTRLLALAREGDLDALHRLMPVVYDRLHLLAQRQRRRAPSETLNTTALVHEAYEKLVHGSTSFADRQHFFRVAARAMRDVLVDHARAQRRQKRGGGVRAVPLDESLLPSSDRVDHLLALDEALDRLSALDARQAEVVQLRYFVGLSIPETAEVLGLSDATIKRDWTAARAWLLHTLSEAP